MSKRNNMRTVRTADGVIRYVKDGKLHNSEGAAVIHPDGTEEYYLNGFPYTKLEFNKLKLESEGLPWYKSGITETRN